MWGDTPAIGPRFIVFGHLREVVGVVEDGKYHEVAEPRSRFSSAAVAKRAGQHDFRLRSARAQKEIAAAIERTLSSLEPNALIAVQSWPRQWRMRSPCPGGSRVLVSWAAGGDGCGNGYQRDGSL